MLENIQSKVKSYFNNWIQVLDVGNEITIESFPYSEGAQDVGNHCAQ